MIYSLRQKFLASLSEEYFELVDCILQEVAESVYYSSLYGNIILFPYKTCTFYSFYESNVKLFFENLLGKRIFLISTTPLDTLRSSFPTLSDDKLLYVKSETEQNELIQFFTEPTGKGTLIEVLDVLAPQVSSTIVTGSLLSDSPVSILDYCLQKGEFWANYQYKTTGDTVNVSRPAYNFLSSLGAGGSTIEPYEKSTYFDVFKRDGNLVISGIDKFPFTPQVISIKFVYKSTSASGGTTQLTGIVLEGLKVPLINSLSGIFTKGGSSALTFTTLSSGVKHSLIYLDPEPINSSNNLPSRNSSRYWLTEGSKLCNLNVSLLWGEDNTYISVPILPDYPDLQTPNAFRNFLLSIEGITTNPEDASSIFLSPKEGSTKVSDAYFKYNSSPFTVKTKSVEFPILEWTVLRILTFHFDGTSPNLAMITKLYPNINLDNEIVAPDWEKIVDSRILIQTENNTFTGLSVKFPQDFYFPNYGTPAIPKYNLGQVENSAVLSAFIDKGCYLDSPAYYVFSDNVFEEGVDTYWYIYVNGRSGLMTTEEVLDTNEVSWLYDSADVYPNSPLSIRAKIILGNPLGFLPQQSGITDTSIVYNIKQYTFVKGTTSGKILFQTFPKSKFENKQNFSYIDDVEQGDYPISFSTDTFRVNGQDCVIASVLPAVTNSSTYSYIVERVSKDVDTARVDKYFTLASDLTYKFLYTDKDSYHTNSDSDLYDLSTPLHTRNYVTIPKSRGGFILSGAYAGVFLTYGTVEDPSTAVGFSPIILESAGSREFTITGGLLKSTYYTTEDSFEISFVVNDLGNIKPIPYSNIRNGYLSSNTFCYTLPGSSYTVSIAATYNSTDNKSLAVWGYHRYLPGMVPSKDIDMFLNSITLHLVICATYRSVSTSSIEKVWTDIPLVFTATSLPKYSCYITDKECNSSYTTAARSDSYFGTDKVSTVVGSVYPPFNTESSSNHNASVVASFTRGSNPVQKLPVTSHDAKLALGITDASLSPIDGDETMWGFAPKYEKNFSDIFSENILQVIGVTEASKERITDLVIPAIWQ